MKKLDILYEDKYLLIVNKPSKMLTIASANDKRSLYSLVYDYLKKKNKNNKVFIVHRLDKDTQGIIVFAKDELVKKELQANWDKVKREYIAIVEGKLPKNKDRLINYLKISKSLLVYVSNKGKKAITNYEVMKTFNNYSLLKINIETGRQNQIRVQLSHIGNPIAGDKKYKAKTNPINMLALQACYISFIHPITKEVLEISIPIPKKFLTFSLTKE